MSIGSLLCLAIAIGAPLDQLVDDAKTLQHHFVLEYHIRNGSMVENGLKSWSKAEGSTYLPPKNMLNPKLRLHCYWLTEQGACFTVHPLPHSKVKIEYTGAGCLSTWYLKREGTFRNGVLVLDRPVTDYSHNVYDRLYAIRWRGVDYLVPESLAERFVRERKTITGHWWDEFPTGAEYYAFISDNEKLRRRNTFYRESDRLTNRKLTNGNQCSFAWDPS